MKKYVDYLFSLQESCKEAIGIIEASCENSNDQGLHKEIHSKLTNAIHSIMDCWVRIGKQTDIDSEDANYLRVFRCVCNELKHNKEFITFHLRINSSRYPTRYPVRYGDASVEWKVISKMSDPKYESQLKHYKKYLENKEVDTTLKQALAIIEKYFLAIHSLIPANIIRHDAKLKQYTQDATKER